MTLHNKTALITGTSPNICGGIAVGMADAGAQVVCVDVQPENAHRCADYIKQRGGEALGVVCDVTDEAQVQAAVAQARETFGGIDILDRKSTRLNSSHLVISYAVFCLKKKKK